MTTTTTILYPQATGSGITWSLPQGFSCGCVCRMAAVATTLPKNNIRLGELIQEKIRCCRSLNTRRGYESFLRYFNTRHGVGPLAESVSLQFIDSFALHLEKDFPESTSQRNLFMVKLSAIVSKARAIGLLTSKEQLSFPRYPCMRADHNLTEGETAIIYDIYRRLIVTDPEMRETETMAAAVFIIDIAFQGLAPVDLASLRICDLRIMQAYQEEKNPLKYARDEDYRRTVDSPGQCIDAIFVDTFRKKTGVPVRIVAALTPIKEAFQTLCKGKEGDDYLIPCFDRRKDYTPEQRQSRLANYFHKLSVALNRSLSDYYRLNGLGESRRVTYYFARHAFCNLADSLELPRHIIQKMIGHRQSVLERSYLRDPTPWEQARVTGSIFERLL